MGDNYKKDIEPKGQIKNGDFVWISDKKEKVKFIEKEEGRLNVRFWKPNLFQRVAYYLGIMKDPRYNGKKFNFPLQDEVGPFNQHL